MASKSPIRQFLAVVLVISLLVVACERPLARDDEDTTAQVNDNTEVVTTEEETQAEPTEESEQPAGEPVSEPTEEPEAAEPEPMEESPRPEEAEPEEAAEPVTVEEEAAETPEETAETPEETEATAETTEETETAEEPEAEAPEAEEPEPELITEEEAEAAEEQVLPATHTVAAGENLYRIGLRYGLSWVTLAQFNNLRNANFVFAGQVLRIPGGEAPAPETPEGVNYIVRPGDNLYRIGLAFGVNWVQIAEANGIVNPNQIFVGQELKIPASAPGPAPVFTHVVQPGESLTRIALRYGVSWLAIAQENGVASPYVIYPGQTLVIPGG